MLAQVILTSAPVLLNLDPSFKVELSWLQDGAYQALGLAIEQKIVECLPTKTVASTLSQTDAKLQALSVSQMVKLASRESQSSLQAVKMIIAKMNAGAAPADSIKVAGGLYSKLWTHLEYFVSYTGKTTTIYGGSALKAKLSALQGLLKSRQTPVQLNELTVFQVYYNKKNIYKCI
jgi:hypothetical protein